MDILKKNFFEIFGLPVSINIDLVRLEKSYTSLQKEFHPDKFSNSSDHEKRLALQISSYLNDGYSVLKNIITRIEYILRIENKEPDENKTLQDSNFLIEQLELNEVIESLEHDNKNNSEIDVIKKNIVEKMDILIKSIEQGYSKSNYESVWVNLSKYKFYNNHLHQIEGLQSK